MIFFESSFKVNVALDTTKLLNIYSGIDLHCFVPNSLLLYFISFAEVYKLLQNSESIEQYVTEV